MQAGEAQLPDVVHLAITCSCSFHDGFMTLKDLICSEGKLWDAAAQRREHRIGKGAREVEEAVRGWPAANGFEVSPVYGADRRAERQRALHRGRLGLVTRRPFLEQRRPDEVRVAQCERSRLGVRAELRILEVELTARASPRR